MDALSKADRPEGPGAEHNRRRSEAVASAFGASGDEALALEGGEQAVGGASGKAGFLRELGEFALRLLRGKRLEKGDRSQYRLSPGRRSFPRHSRCYNAGARRRYRERPVSSR